MHHQTCDEKDSIRVVA